MKSQTIQGRPKHERLKVCGDITQFHLMQSCDSDLIEYCPGVVDSIIALKVEKNRKLSLLPDLAASLLRHTGPWHFRVFEFGFAQLFGSAEFVDVHAKQVDNTAEVTIDHSTP